MATTGKDAYLSVACPRCGAAVGQACVSGNGNSVSPGHAARAKACEATRLAATSQRAGVEGYEQLGDPDEPYELTKKDHRRQRNMVAIRESVKRSFDGHWHTTETEDGGRGEFCHAHDEDTPNHTHPPERQYPNRADGGWHRPETGPARDRPHGPSPEAIASVRSILEASARRNREHPEDLMQWRVRLYCGHVVERTAHHTSTRLHQAFTGLATTCPECSQEGVIVAAKATGRLDPLPGNPKPKPPQPGQPTLGQRVADLQAEIASLRRELEEASHHGSATP